MLSSTATSPGSAEECTRPTGAMASAGATWAVRSLRSRASPRASPMLRPLTLLASCAAGALLWVVFWFHPELLAWLIIVLAVLR